MPRYNPLSPPRVVAVTRRMGRTRRGLGADDTSTLNVPEQTITSTPLDVAGQALVDALNSTGCQQTQQTSVSNFQAQWNAAGSSPQLSVDGWYGNDTASALQNWAASDVAAGDTAQNIPAGCVASAQSTNTSAGATFTPGQSSSGVSSTLASVQADLAVVPWWGWAAAAAAGAALYYEHSKKHPLVRRGKRLGRKAKRHIRRLRRRLARRR